MTALDDALGGDLRPVLELAALAPSVHNSQPWRFQWDGSRLHVHEDRSRGLTVLDPSGRERVLSCGAAVLHARLGLAALGHDCRTTLLPDPDRADRLATLEVTGRREPDADERSLVEAIPRRATDRDPFDDRPVPEQAREALRLAAEAEGAWVRFVAADGSGEAVELQVLLSHADEEQRSDPAYLEELAAWRRAREAEGVPSSALPSIPAERRASTWVARDFDASGGPAEAAGPGGKDPDPPVAEHPAVLVLGTTGDGPEDWLLAGQALARVLLRATVDGLAAQPLTQVLEIPVLRERMRHVLGGVGHPQVLLRLGYGHAGPSTKRRPVEDVLTLVNP